MKKTLVIGATVLDIILQIEHLPVTGEDIHIQSQKMALGGCAYNAADILRLSEVPYTLLSPIGTGMYAVIVETMLKEKGFQTGIRIPDKDNGFCLCMVEKDGERTFVVYHGVEYSFKKAWLSTEQLKEYDSVYISGFEVEESDGYEIVEFLEENRDFQIYFAPGPRLVSIGEDKLNRIFALSPILHLNEEEAFLVSKKDTVEEAASYLYGLTRKEVIITLGSRGAYCLTNGKGCYVDGNRAEVVDTIGAGDSHIGAIMACLKQGLSLEEAIRRANKVSAAVVGVKGSSLSEEIFSEIT
ncbi:MAG TPA: PfkB family carbohydrate kinase [Lachnospiraceae bacterium]|nr:PfkB family carbohydrate kinase [Lachnospiraceae bacterium]